MILSADWVVPVSAPPVRDGAIAIEDGRIAAVGTTAELGEGKRHTDSVILPGFVNAHSHLEYAVYAGFGDGLAFAPWLVLHNERKARLSFEQACDVARLGAAQCLQSGITTDGDASFSGGAAVACDELGLRATVYLEVFGGTAEQVETRFAPNRDRIAGHLSERVRLGISPHAPYTCGLDLYAACIELGLPVATHLAESPGETDWLLRGEGDLTPFAHILVPPLGETGVRALAGRGLLSPNVTAAHCVLADAEEIELLARHDVAVAHCPRSNAVLGCGIAPVADLLDAGVRVGIGTDSPASTPSFDMFAELRTAVYLARLRAARPEAMPASRALELATLGSAHALGLAGEIGSLEVGKRADLAVVSLAGSSLLPWEDPAAAVVLGGSPERVVTTIVGGEVRYAAGSFEWRELLRRGNHARRTLLGLSRSSNARPSP